MNKNTKNTNPNTAAEQIDFAIEILEEGIIDTVKEYLCVLEKFHHKKNDFEKFICEVEGLTGVLKYALDGDMKAGRLPLRYLLEFKNSKEFKQGERKYHIPEDEVATIQGLRERHLLNKNQL